MAVPMPAASLVHDRLVAMIGVDLGQPALAVGVNVDRGNFIFTMWRGCCEVKWPPARSESNHRNCRDFGQDRSVDVHFRLVLSVSAAFVWRHIIAWPWLRFHFGSSNRTGGFPASGSRTRTHADSHRWSYLSLVRRTSPRARKGVDICVFRSNGQKTAILEKLPLDQRIHTDSNGWRLRQSGWEDVDIHKCYQRNYGRCRSFQLG
jgi:hypothetical protein